MPQFSKKACLEAINGNEINLIKRSGYQIRMQVTEEIRKKERKKSEDKQTRKVKKQQKERYKND